MEYDYIWYIHIIYNEDTTLLQLNEWWSDFSDHVCICMFSHTRNKQTAVRWNVITCVCSVSNCYQTSCHIADRSSLSCWSETFVRAFLDCIMSCNFSRKYYTCVVHRISAQVF
jgi:hypothetical protein